jgi:hypothetical protein
MASSAFLLDIWIVYVCWAGGYWVLQYAVGCGAGRGGDGGGKRKGHIIAWSVSFPKRLKACSGLGSLTPVVASNTFPRRLEIGIGLPSLCDIVCGNAQT